MDRPSKRPRLSMFRDLDDTDVGLETARDHNDRRLKSRFESIFEKYERDFTNVADEIDLMTGRIVVNNGHLASMQSENDIGWSSRGRSSRDRSVGSEKSDEQRYDGGRILRAMTVAPPNFDNPRTGSGEDQDDDVLLLFERLAEDASQRAMSSGPFVKREKEIKKETDSPNKNGSTLEESYTSLPNEDLTQVKRESDHDSNRSLRSESPDSLLDGDTSRERSTSLDSLMDEDTRSMESSSQDSLMESESYEPEDLYKSIEATDEPAYDPNDDEAIIEQYGPEVGEQVLEVLRQRKAAEEARVEPAWRLPDVGPSFESRKSTADRTHTPEPATPAPDFISPRGSSLWMARQTRKRKPKISPPRRRDSEASAATEDSEDPLQEDFRDPINDKDAIKNWQYYLDHNVCPYCKQHKLHLSQHFRHMADRGQDGVHDIEYLDRYCKSRQVGEVTIRMFLDVVKYKELDNLAFVDIADRMGHPMQFVYNTYYQYRATQKSEEELAAEGRSFTQAEDDLLRKETQDENATFRKLRSVMKGRRIGEIGYRLATLHMRTFEEQGFQLSEPGVKRRTKRPALHEWMQPQGHEAGDEDYSSEDDLTGDPPLRSASDVNDYPVDLTVSD